MDSRVFQEAIRSATVTYPVPFIFSVLLLFAVICFGGCAFTIDWLHVLLGIIGAGSAVSAVAIVMYAILFKPELLRSEHHVQSMTIAQIIGDKDMDQTTRSGLVSRLELDPPRGRRDTKGDHHHG
jgi:hypothetical protein